MQSPRRASLAAGAMSVGALLLSAGLTPGGIKAQRPERKCLNCPRMHRHNAAYCSPECCKEYRRASRAAGENG